jgi:hypothetical protein
MVLMLVENVVAESDHAYGNSRQGVSAVAGADEEAGILFALLAGTVAGASIGGAVAGIFLGAFFPGVRSVESGSSGTIGRVTGWEVVAGDVVADDSVTVLEIGGTKVPAAPSFPCNTTRATMVSTAR